MLVLSRKAGEEVMIGENIRVTVVAIRGNQVRLGFTAPADISINRLELCEPLGFPTLNLPPPGLPARIVNLDRGRQPAG